LKFLDSGGNTTPSEEDASGSDEERLPGIGEPDSCSDGGAEAAGFCCVVTLSPGGFAIIIKDSLHIIETKNHRIKTQ